MKRVQTFSTFPILLSLFAIGSMLAAPSTEAAGRAHFRNLIGSWVLQVQPDSSGPPPFVNVTSFTSAGIVINSDPAFGTGHGAWTRMGRKEFSVKFTTLVPPSDPMFPPGSFINVSGTIKMNPQGETFTGDFTSEFFDESENLLFSTTGELSGTRLTAH